MSLAEWITQETAPPKPCKTCDRLSALTDEDRVDFAEAVAKGLPGALLSRALNRRAAQLGISGTVGEASVRKHINGKHP